MSQLDKDEKLVFQELIASVNSLKSAIVQPKIGNNATISVNAGGVGVWVATTCCLMMLGVNVFLAVLVLDHSRKIDDLGDYLHAIYQLAPTLKPEDYDKKEKGK